jgi:hypothetical protein
MDVIFQECPDFQLGTLTFRNVPTIIQFCDTPLLQVGQFAEAGYTTQFHIFHRDGTDLAIVKGANIFKTPDGERVGLALRNEPQLIVCELDGQTLFELRHIEASALRGWAELYTPTGLLVRAKVPLDSVVKYGEDWTEVGNVRIKSGVFENCPVGIYLTDKARVIMKAEGGSISLSELKRTDLGE